MSYIITIQSHSRRYLQQKKYIRIYNAVYTIQCFILHRIDMSILLENIKYLANFSKSKDKVQFLQKKTHTHKKKNKKNIHIHKQTIELLHSTIKTHISEIGRLHTRIHTYKQGEEHYKNTIQEKQDIITIYKDKHKGLHDEINALTEIIAEKNTKNKTLVLQNKTLEKKYTNVIQKCDVLQRDFTQLIEQYTHSNETRGSLENVNDSLQVVNNTLSVQLNEIYINLLETQGDLDKHKHKTIWDILFNKIK